jgi:hypothetical protein
LSIAKRLLRALNTLERDGKCVRESTRPRFLARVVGDEVLSNLDLHARDLSMLAVFNQRIVG